MGFSSDSHRAAARSIHLSLAFNPSHLEAVNPVVEGRVRAKQDRSGDAERTRVMPLLIHGDAAFIGQGVVAETLNLVAASPATARAAPSTSSSTTRSASPPTRPTRARSIYSTAVAQMLDVPVFHVNGDDPEACVHVVRLAAEYRQTLQERRRHRPRLLPPLRPQRGRRAVLHPAARCTS